MNSEKGETLRASQKAAKLVEAAEAYLTSSSSGSPAIAIASGQAATGRRAGRPLTT